MMQMKQRVKARMKIIELDGSGRIGQRDISRRALQDVVDTLHESFDRFGPLTGILELESRNAIGDITSADNSRY